MGISQKRQKRIGFGFGALLGVFFWLIQKGYTTWSLNPSLGVKVAGQIVLLFGLVGVGITVLDTLFGTESLPAWFEGLVSGFVMIVGLGDLILGEVALT